MRLYLVLVFLCVVSRFVDQCRWFLNILLGCYWPLPFPSRLAMPFHNPQRRGKEVELRAQLIVDIPLIGKVQTRFAARGKDHKGRGAHADLR